MEIYVTNILSKTNMGNKYDSASGNAKIFAVKTEWREKNGEGLKSDILILCLVYAL